MESKIKTSDEYPLNVNLVIDSRLGAISGKLGMTIAPGKYQAVALSGGTWRRDLSKDLDLLVAKYHCAVLVTLLEEKEFGALKIPGLIPEAKKRGIESVWFPIPDGGIPDSVKECDTTVKKILGHASKGETVVVHCMGGLGRTGVIVACCLIKVGFPAREAIEAVRKARKGTIENKLQEAFVAKYAESVAKMVKD